MTQTSFQAFRLADRRMFSDVVVDEAAGKVLLPGERRRAQMDQVVLLPSIGMCDRNGKSIYLGDVLAKEEGDVRKTYIVGPLPGRAEIVSAFALRGYRQYRRGGNAQGLREAVEVTPDVMATLRVVGNLYRHYKRYVPRNESYCYRGLGWKKDGLYHTLSCPFYRHSDHGVVYCRLLQLGSVPNRTEDRAKALAHYGTEAALEVAAPLWILWDQVKECGVHRPD
jgi:hypothetical protein